MQVPEEVLAPRVLLQHAHFSMKLHVQVTLMLVDQHDTGGEEPKVREEVHPRGPVERTNVVFR